MPIKVQSNWTGVLIYWYTRPINKLVHAQYVSASAILDVSDMQELTSNCSEIYKAIAYNVRSYFYSFIRTNMIYKKHIFDTFIYQKQRM